MGDHDDIPGRLRTDAPHVRLAGLRLRELGEEIDAALAGPGAGASASALPLSMWLAFAAMQAEDSLRQLAADMERLNQGILLRRESATVADVDRAVRRLRPSVRALFALRNACHPARFAAHERAQAGAARARIDAWLVDFARYCALLATSIIHPERMPTGADLEVMLQFELARELSALAARTRTPMPLWRYC